MACTALICSTCTVILTAHHKIGYTPETAPKPPDKQQYSCNQLQEAYTAARNAA